MVLKKVNKKYRVNLVAEIIARGNLRGFNSEMYLREIICTYTGPQSLIDLPSWVESAKGFEYWRQAFNEHGTEQR